MSTRSMIFVEVLPKDLGKEVKPNKNLIYKKGLQFENIDDDTRIADEEVDKFPAILLDKKYIGIYHHWQGGPLTVGRSLIENFNTYKEALNLMLYGCESSIIYGRVRPYTLRGGKYKSNDGEPPLLEDEIPLDLAYSCWSDYVYLFTNGAWQFASTFHDESSGKYDWKPLHETLTIYNEMDAEITRVAIQQRDHKVSRCPRCGRNNMHYSKKKGTYGVLSRVGRIYICDKCGEAEALDADSGEAPIPLAEWSMFKNFFKREIVLFPVKEYDDQDYWYYYADSGEVSPGNGGDRHHVKVLPEPSDTTMDDIWKVRTRTFLSQD